MAEITTAMIMDLRARTNAGMMDCKQALIETNGDMDEAIKQLRLKGQAIQVKRASKEANQGLVAVALSDDETVGALVQVNCETDFVAKTENFQKFVGLVADKALAGSADLAADLKNEIADLTASTGENLKIGNSARYILEGPGKLESYIHMGGKVGVLVEVGCTKPETPASEAFRTMVHDLSLHIAAASPRYLDASEVPAEVADAEKELYRQQMEGEKKPANVLEKIIEGRIGKFYSEICLLDQPFVKEPKQSIKQLVAEAAKATGDELTIRRFARFNVG